MEIRRELSEWLGSIEGDENTRLQLEAFGDFFLDLFEEQYGRTLPDEEIESRCIKGLLAS